MRNWIEKELMKAKQVHQLVDSGTGEHLLSVNDELTGLLHSRTWTEKQLNFFHGWMKKLDVAKKHYTQYQSNWKLSQERTKTSTECYKLSLLMALKYVNKLDKGTNFSQLLKTSNVIYKIIGHLSDETYPNKTTIENYLGALIDNHKVKVPPQSKAYNPIKKDSSVLPLTVLFWEGPIARAYLATIKQMGYKVQKIIKLVSSVDLITKKPVGKFLPESMKAKYAANKQYKQIFYWPNVYKSKNTELVESIQRQVNLSLGFELKTQESATENCELQQYTQELESLSITGLKDKALENKLKSEEADLFLFTGGGIVPDQLLSLQNKRLIHVHPGFLPNIRGADCVLWSQLTANRLSASAFFLAPGIDVGDIIAPFWLPAINLKFPESLNNQAKYRMAYSFLDPWVRSYVLKQAIYSTHGLKDFNTSKQIETDGMTYHFMHDKMKQIALGNLS